MAPSGRSTSASLRATDSPRSWAAARCCTTECGSWWFARPRDAAALVVSLLRIPPARPRGLPGLRRGRLPARVAARDRAVLRPARVHLRPGPGLRRRVRAAPVARSRGTHTPALASARRGRVLRDVLLRFGHALLSGQGAVRAGRPDADLARAGALCVLAPLGAEADRAAPDRHGRRACRTPAARSGERVGLRRQELHARARDRDPASAPLGSERLAQRPGQPCPAR